ncbi:acyltransferase family protein [Larkinella rosea]|nr:acyltransferase [Larkinella rosea]
MITQTSTCRPKSIESIRALRAVAALLVTLFHLAMKMETTTIHSPVLRCFKSGFGGVDVFFIISGFIITHTNLTKINCPHLLPTYLKKRLGRIYAIYWPTVLLATLLLLWLSRLAPALQWLSFPVNPVGVLKAVVLLPTHESTLPVTWTLSYEIYFYVLFGLVIASRFLLIIPLFILGATLLTGLAECFGKTALFQFPFHDFFFSPFNLEFCLGIGVYFLTRRCTFKISRSVVAAAIGCFFLTGELIDPALIWQRILGFGIPGSVILAGLVSWEQSDRCRYPDWLLKLGDASYILYLIHVPIIMVLTQAMMRLSLSDYVVTANFILIGVLCWGSWQLHLRIEKPILAWISIRQFRPIGFRNRFTGISLMRIGKPQTAHKMVTR